jgi:hypothetical protein
LKELGRSLKEMPLVIQFNKRDLPQVRKDEELESLAKKGKEPVFKGCAVNGQGVLETFFGLLHLTWAKLDQEHQLAQKLHIDSNKFLGSAAQKLGFDGSVEELLQSCVGGQLPAVPRSAVR